MLHFDADLLDHLRFAESITVLSGAGVSAESGIPTFRDAMTGLWAQFDPEQLATPEAFARDPQFVSRWYDERRCNVAQCRPNAGHAAVAELQRQTLARGARFTLITQNVDRPHQAAGSSDVVELHGSLWVWRCEECGFEAEERGPAFDTHPPRCACGGRRRPGVVWFGEELPKRAMLAAERASASANLFVSLGTSSVVYPAAALVQLAIARGAKVLEVNLQHTPLSERADWSLRGRSGAVLPALIAAAFGPVPG